MWCNKKYEEIVAYVLKIKIKLFLFAYDMIIYIENVKESMKKILKINNLASDTE